MAEGVPGQGAASAQAASAQAASAHVANGTESFREVIDFSLEGDISYELELQMRHQRNLLVKEELLSGQCVHVRACAACFSLYPYVSSDDVCTKHIYGCLLSIDRYLYRSASAPAIDGRLAASAPF